MRMPPVGLRIEPVTKRNSPNDRAEIEKGRGHRAARVRPAGDGLGLFQSRLDHWGSYALLLARSAARLAASAFRRAWLGGTFHRDINRGSLATGGATAVAAARRVPFLSRLQMARPRRAYDSWHDGAGDDRRQRRAGERGREQYFRVRHGRRPDSVAKHCVSPDAIAARNFRRGGRDRDASFGLAQRGGGQHQRVSLSTRAFGPAGSAAHDSGGDRSDHSRGTDYSADLPAWPFYT